MPGYKRDDTEDSDPYKVETCTKIENCKETGQNWANACNECQTDFTFEYKNGEILYTSCVNGG